MFRKSFAIPLVGLALTIFAVPPRAAVAQADAASTEVSDDRVKVRVSNNNFADMRVYAVNGGRQWRLGTVTSFTSELLTVPRFVSLPLHELRLVAIPIGGRRGYSSPPILVEPGDVVEFRIENNAALSSAYVLPIG